MISTLNLLRARIADIAGAPKDAPQNERPIVSGYRPWLDGVRAVAIAAVLAQHTWGNTPVELGSIGVGLFFGLSGYLITSILLNEWSERGSVSLGGFYLRRAARLVPALLLVVIACDVLFLVQHEFRPIVGSLAAATYTANYALIVQPDAVPGFGPTWSLAVEEHFYLLWPLFLLWIANWRGLRVGLWATLGICFFAVLWRLILTSIDAPDDLIAIGSLERADALLYGCAAAMAVRLGWRPQRWMLWAAVGAVLLLPYGMKLDHDFSLIVGNGVLALASAALAVGLDYGAPGWMRRALSVRLVVALGVVSYGVYLWHGPLMRIAANAGFEGRAWRAAIAVVALVVAAASYRIVEQPVRVWARRRTGRPQVGPAPTPQPAIARIASDRRASYARDPRERG